MNARKKAQLLMVSMNGVKVGELSRLGNSNLRFSYDSNWLNHPSCRPISLTLPLTEHAYEDERVLNFFDNLLPDNEDIRNRIQRRFQADSNHCFDLLYEIGGDCIGALQLSPNEEIKKNNTITAQPITNSQISTLLKNYRQAPLGMSESSDFRISIAGAQEKTALLWFNKHWHIPKANTPTTHIFKLPIGHIAHANIDLTDSVENEWLCLEILKTFDLPVANAKIAYFNDAKALIVERFDRRWTSDQSHLIRLPQEDFCQALNVSCALKYESDGGPRITDCMNLLKGSNHPAKNRQQFMKTIFLFWLLGAIDGHAKNFSCFIYQGGAYELTPIYDVMSAYPLCDKRQLEWQDIKMAMSLKGKNRHYHWHTLQKRHWIAEAKHCHFPEKEMEDMISSVCHSVDTVIDSVKKKLPKNFPKQIADSIFAGIKKAKDKIS